MQTLNNILDFEDWKYGSRAGNPKRSGGEILSLTGSNKPDKIVQVSEGISCDPIYLVFKDGECKVVAFGKNTKAMVVLCTLRPKRGLFNNG